MELVIASGYANTYGGDAAEFALSKEKGHWFPTTTDFRVTAAHSNGTGEAKTFAELLKWIDAKKVGSIDGLGIVGHASPTVFSLAGKVTSYPFNVNFFDSGIISPDTVNDNLAKIQSLQNRFAKDARMVLFSCSFGANGSVLEALSKAFGVCVEGYKNEMVWCLSMSGKNLQRGRTFYDGNGLGVYPKCEDFSDDIRTWGRDNESCAGVSKTTTKP
jgi:hypothetical protein